MKEVMIGNFAIARGLVEAGLELAAAYPGTPSSEILPGIVEFKKREKLNIHAEWSTNERCAFEVAFGGAMAGRKAACMMKQVGLNVAFPPLLHAYAKSIKGGFVIVSCDDPGPQSSQTEQDTRLIAAHFGIPVFDPASPKEAGDIAYYALKYSYEHKTAVILRSTHRVSHARESIELFKPGSRKVELDEGLKYKGKGKLGIVSSGMTYSITMDVISELGLEKQISLYKVSRVFPLAPEVLQFVNRQEKVLVLEETDVALEAILDHGAKVLGRRSGHVPVEGELTYDIVRSIIGRVAKGQGMKVPEFNADTSIETALKEVKVTPRPPKLCAGCSHRASFYAMKSAFPDAIFPGDIGCYTLGTSLGAVDTCHDMGSGVTFASGFYETFSQDGTLKPILASVGDSTFFHACLAPLYDGALRKRRFILVIMDNSTTAMTGLQPTPQTGITADGTPTYSIKIEHIIGGFGIEFLRIIDPYDIPLMLETIKEAYKYLEKESAGPAVIIARRECLL
ncbi:MAG: indolepyruvate ferredoxin oxidoreductase, alpha subunit, partial [Deltaproteobacteria bacterium]|nr:indolepyruvate ferredoxin oxidoreductase, alpha subunit [Deltaproteobacteria bacterium]